MTVQTSRIFSLLLVVSVSSVIFILSQEELLKSWTTFPGKNGLRWESVSFDIKVWGKKGETSGAPSVFTEASKAKIVDSTKINPVTEPKSSTHGAVTETPMPLLYKTNFTKLPQWNFDDVYNQDAPPRLTTCAQSLRNSQDEKFKKAFLPNIRLFLHKDNINMSEWNRLSHFNNPFGFMEYKYDDVMASVKLIPKPKEPLLLPKPAGDGCVHCAVVGTAGILNGSKMGAEIDAHDYVFRMNAAVTEGFEEDVGNRTSVYVHTAHSITSSLYFYRKYGYKSAPYNEGIKYVMIPEGMRDFQWLEGLLKGQQVSSGQFQKERPRTYYSGQYNESRFYVLHQDFLRYVRNRFLKSSNLNATFWPIVRPTNGAFTLFLALHTCDTVDAYGFMTDEYNKYSNYYFEKYVKNKVIFYVNHDYVLEKNTWKNLHDRKIIKLYQRTDPAANRKRKTEVTLTHP
ncbi:alpha-N-acetylgalactosaminide alpha-2,6-sialyltransferase 2-like [Archocentrus centrarchus]|uniref:alpha-N-acetylgalactosaminide alpha-2,6-sialyltransferase 2-like n=1 Tax=Archocentrus centrarchus TaxID=63155 RepID=UPI0011EA0C88|nr:alpha-N-acetylgalactosaminide alpha-2,6-sialyltransferase 2-like [Archocentrus centrarchus]XP_030610102.1 alpha-N-acetylgalactosaminide alpha-2,6-sialyltransferase 2-like [Archocentrus centrarchus]